MISIAGLDPSGGAGILADVKTFEQLGINGFAVCTAITLQTESEFKGISWIPVHQIELQLDTLLQKYDVEFLKIGLIQNLPVLDELIQSIRRKYPRIKVIWDPVLRSSSGFEFHTDLQENVLYEILSQTYLVTPNNEEAKMMMHTADSLIAVKGINRFTSVFMKSYRDERMEAYDLLMENGEEFFFRTDSSGVFEKHGSGCVLSAAITAFLAKGYTLKSACTEAKAYTLEFLKSTEGLLGSHNQINMMSHHE